MRSDYDLIVRHLPERSDVLIYPISDVHLGAAEHMEQAWTHFCAQLLQQPNAYITLGGDLINNATRSSVSNIFEETMRPREQKRMMVEMLTPLRERILCAVTGNHERRSGKDADNDPTYDIMCKLDLEDLYRENLAFVKLRLGDVDADGEKNPTYTLMVMHGHGGGMLTGGAVNRNERFAYAIDGVDCVITGHSHKPFITQPSKIIVDGRNNKVYCRPFKIISATSWLSFGGYAAAKQLLPSSHAPQVVTLSGKCKNIRVTM